MKNIGFRIAFSYMKMHGNEIEKDIAKIWFKAMSSNQNHHASRIESIYGKTALNFAREYGTIDEIERLFKKTLKHV